MDVFSAARLRWLIITLLLALMFIGQMLFLHQSGVKTVTLIEYSLPLCATVLLCGLSAWLLRPPQAPSLPIPFAPDPAPEEPPPPTPPTASLPDVVLRCGKAENTQVLKEVLREMKGAKELLGSLDEHVQTLSGEMKSEHAVLQRRLRKMRARQRRLLGRLEPVATPELENGQTLDLTRLLDDDQRTLRFTELRQHLAHVSKDELNQLLEVLIELLERETDRPTAGDAARN